MAEQNSAQERSEQATPKRKEQAKSKGQIARSKELGTAAVLFASVISLMVVGEGIGEGFTQLAKNIYSMNREQIFDINQVYLVFGMSTQALWYPLLVLFVLIGFASFFGNIILGGVTFSTDALLPKGSKMNPLTGLKRMFGIQAAIELIKGLLKFFVVAICAYLLLSFHFNEILMLSSETAPTHIIHALNLLIWMLFFICCSFFLIVAIDVPYQIWNHNKQLKMTKQEIKDELKDTEGRPEVKSKEKQLQREIAQRRMLTEVSNADVIVVNPEHYAVAIRYDIERASAPFVIAKGIDEIAFNIRKIGQKYDIAIVSAPPLARAIYYTTDIEQQIPDGLFTAVAQVLAYVYQLKDYQQGKGKKPTPVPENQPIPKEFQF